MIYKDSCPPDTPLVPVIFSFLAPATLKIRRVDGRIETLRFGIGEKLSVMKPQVVNLVCVYEKHKEILLEDGSYIIEYPDDINVARER